MYLKKLLPVLGLIVTGLLIFNESPRSTATSAAQDVSISASTSLVISQVYGGGGGSSGTPTYNTDYVEIKNISGVQQSLSGISLMYGSATGNFGASSSAVTPLPAVTLQPGQHYLIALGSGSAGRVLPVTPDIVGSTAMSATSGKVALTKGLSANFCGATPCPLPNANIIDLVAYGTANNAEGGLAVGSLSTTTGAARKTNGCTDTDVNRNDFTVVTNPVPRNSGSSFTSCVSGSVLQAAMAANPTSVTAGASTLITVTVSPATSPASTGITVVANLSAIGGSSTQTLYDNGTNGDTVAFDNIFSFTATVPSTVSAGTKNISATARDAEARTATASTTVGITTPAQPDQPLIFGNPSNATAIVTNENNYLMTKPQYTLSYNRGRATANWVAWRIGANWLGSTPRQDDFRADTTLPSGWYQVTGSDYTGSGYDRGHMCPSADRTSTVADNSATFLMTNMVPQLPENNQGPWAQFESYLRTLVTSGNEVYVFSGVYGNAGTISLGRITVPTQTWKVVLVLPEGSNDLTRVTSKTRAFGIVVPNQSPLSISAPWRDFRKTVDEVEALTGHNFFSLVNSKIQATIESRRDTL